MDNVIQTLKKNSSTIIKLTPILAIIVPFAILYVYQGVAHPPYPYMYYGTPTYVDTFGVLWKGRAFYLFFLWLFALEMILGWEEIQAAISKIKSPRTIIFIIALLLPTAYVVYANYSGFNKTIVDLSYASGLNDAIYRPPDWVPLSTEYLVLVVLFALPILFGCGFKGLSNFSISLLFLGTIGLMYTVDNLYPFGLFTPFQFLVFPTSTLSAGVLNVMGYQTAMYSTASPNYGWMPLLTAQVPGNPLKSASFLIGWPCAGIESLLIFTVTILLFLKKSAIPLWQKATYFAIGAAVTYFINILRIVSIYVIAISGGNIDVFHNVYGQFYSIIWIIAYPLLIIGSRALWGRVRAPRMITPPIVAS
jgi:exosortase/archaeosortase family protein